ncbi:MAG: BMP family ABC transporter substrate-binding protein [Deltaproteobacteria bacterium]|nr:BMP family ABC transporter substrate-binding protein [Deltaproteobacteria bacterium]
MGAITDAGYNQAQHDGLVELKQNLPFIQILEAENIAESAEAERVMESMIQQGAKLIFATSFGHLEPALAVAERHPDVTFMHAGGYLLADNFGTYFGTPQVYWYSMGVAAGKMTQTNKLGFIGGFPIGFALGNINGFHLGARSVNPDVETFVVFTASWLDRAKEAEATNALLDQGVDVVAMHVDSPITIIQTAEARGAYSIGFQSLAAQEFAPRGWLTGLGFTWGGMMTDTAQQVIDGTWEPAHLRKGIADGYMAVAPFGAAVPDDVQQLVLDTVVAIDGGELNPFCGPILDQDGVVRIAEGECWGNEKMGDFDWFAQGIIGQPK